MRTLCNLAEICGASHALFLCFIPATSPVEGIMKIAMAIVSVTILVGRTLELIPTPDPLFTQGETHGS